MVITWYGQSCFKLQSGDKTLIIDPFSKSIGLTPPAVQADVVFVTHNHFDHNNIKTIKGDPFIINGPGEYELKGIKVLGIESFHDDEGGAKRGLNTLYLISMEDIRVLHLGDLGQSSLADNQLEAIESVDIAMVPVGGHFTIDAKQAVSIINQIAPKIIIPMHYKVQNLTIKELSGVDSFLKEFGEEDIKQQEKLTIKSKDLQTESEKSEVIVFQMKNEK